jgi:predicted nucleotidyltransferase component of viral defense system
MLEKGVSDLLYSTIKQLSKFKSLNEFFLGGGTNLAIRYNHRLSTDIDLFSSKVVGIEALENILQELSDVFGSDKLRVDKNNFEINNLAWLQVWVNVGSEIIKLDIIQNITLYYPIELVDQIQLINEKDIGSLKLLSLADRGVQKDFYDLVLLTEKHSMLDFYNDLMKRDSDKCRIKNIFDSGSSNPYSKLQNSLSPLVDFSKAGDKKSSGNQIKLTSNSTLNPTFISLRQQWIKEVKKVGETLSLEVIPNLKSNQKGYKRKRGFTM